MLKTNKSSLGDTNQGKPVLVLACGALAREIITLIDLNNWHHMSLHCLPAKLHLVPKCIPDAVSEAVKKARKHNKYDRIFVAFADCGTGGLLEKRCEELGVEMIEGPHCYSFFEGNKQFAERAEHEFDAFYLTDFLVRQFNSFVIKPMGLDKNPELRDMYFGNYSKLVYQAQTKDEALARMAKEHAEYLGLTYEYRFTDYGDLAKVLGRLEPQSS